MHSKPGAHLLPCQCGGLINLAKQLLREGLWLRLGRASNLLSKRLELLTKAGHDAACCLACELLKSLQLLQMGWLLRCPRSSRRASNNSRWCGLVFVCVFVAGQGRRKIGTSAPDESCGMMLMPWGRLLALEPHPEKPANDSSNSKTARELSTIGHTEKANRVVHSGAADGPSDCFVLRA